MPEQDGQEKTEQPTGKRLEDSRNKGQVAKSQEINSLAVFGSGLILVYLVKSFLANQLSQLATFVFSSLDTLNLTVDMVSFYSMQAFMFYLKTLAPIFGGLVIISIIAGYSQTGFKITLEAIQPKLNKFDPIKGVKNKFFSSKTLVETAKSILKLVVIGGFIYWILKDAIQNATGLVDWDIDEIVIFMTEVAFQLFWKIALVYTSIAIIDFVYEKFKHKKDLMMTKQEIKDETKQTEGDPFVKGQIKGKQMAMARSRMMQEVPKADVVITNPTHFAIAIKYEIGSTTAPKVLAKGMDEVAQRIKKIASENNIPLHEDVQLARTLYKVCEIGDEIPENLFRAVAQILAYIYQLKRNKKKSIV